jgi:hypothetical protein
MPQCVLSVKPMEYSYPCAISEAHSSASQYQADNLSLDSAAYLLGATVRCGAPLVAERLWHRYCWSHKCYCDSNFAKQKSPHDEGLAGPAFLDHAAAFFFLSAQRFFMARPILLRAAADRCRLRP